MYNQGLFADWVPKQLKLLLIIVFLLPILMINGVYTGNLSAMVAGLGSQNGWVIFANYANVVGMGASLPIILRFKLRFYTKYLMLIVLLGLALTSFMLATTENTLVIVSCSFLIGFMKMFAMMELMIPVMFIISPDGNKSKFYSIFYPVAIIIPQISGYAMTQVGLETYWQNAHFIMVILMLFLTLLLIVFAHEKRFFRKIPLYYIDWIGLFLYVVIFMAMAYFLAFAKQKNYFKSDAITTSAIIMITGVILYKIHHHVTRRPFISLSCLKQYNVFHGIMMLFMLGFFLAGGSLQSKITIGVLGFDGLMNNSYNLWMFPGVITAGFFSMKWLMNHKPLKTYILIGFSAYMFYYIFMYFLVSSNLSYNDLILPTIIRGFGLTILFIGVWLYALDKLSFTDIAGVAALLVLVRTMITPGIWSIVFNYIDSIWSLEALNNMSGKMDAAAYSKRTAMGLYRSVNIEALMISTKRLYGFLVLFGIAILVYVAFLNLEGLDKRKIVLLRKKLKRQNTEGYVTEINQDYNNQRKEEVTAASGTIM